MNNSNFNIVIIENEAYDSEWVKMDKDGYWYIVYHYVNNEVKRKCRYDDFFEAVAAMELWRSYFEFE